MIWKEKRILLIVLAVLLAANTIFFFTYRVQYETRLRALDEQRDRVHGELENARHARVTAEQQLAGYHKVEKDIRQVYDDEWSTQDQRLTPFIGEVMRLATISELVPRSYSFSGTQSKGVAKTASANAVEVSIAFPVEGTYPQIRRLINLLEVSDQFIIIDQITLGSETGDKLNMTIRVKTLFRGVSGGAKAASQEL
jgi:hypothetical protein